MRYLTFGRRTGLRVSEYALGTGLLGEGCGTGGQHAPTPIWGRRGNGASDAEARQMLDRFAAAGGTFIDTADCYQAGQAERLVGDFLAADRDHFVLATKFALGVSATPRISATGNSRKTMVRALEASLRRLGTDYIDLFWVHFSDQITPVEEIMAAFDDLVRAGKILYAGLSNFAAWRVAQAATLADLRGWSPLVGVQTEYSLLERSPDRELLPMAESLGLGLALWSPLGGGLLTGRYRRAADGWVSDRRVVSARATDQAAETVAAVCDIAGATGLSPSHVAMAWLRARAAGMGTALVPIIGPRSLAQLDAYLATLDSAQFLTSTQVAALNQVSAVPLGAPHEVSSAVSDALLGGQADRVISPVPVMA